MPLISVLLQKVIVFQQNFLHYKTPSIIWTMCARYTIFRSSFQHCLFAALHSIEILRVCIHTVYWRLSEMNYICYHLDLLNIFLCHLLYKKQGEGEERGIRDKIKKRKTGDWERELQGYQYRECDRRGLGRGGGRVLRGKVNFFFAGMMWW